MVFAPLNLTDRAKLGLREDWMFSSKSHARQCIDETKNWIYK